MTTKFKFPKTIRFEISSDTAKEVMAAAKEDRKTINEWLKDAAFRARAKNHLLRFAAKTQKYVKSTR